MFKQTKHVTLLRDCKAITIPNGVPITLAKGSDVIITQALGNSYTIYVSGQLCRVLGEDGDALGQAVIALARPVEESADVQGVNLEQIFDQIRTCYDPEIPVNIVDLGLIYDVNCDELIDGRNFVRITMTLTAAGCGMGTIIAEEVKNKCLSVPHVDDVEVALVFDPPWSYDMISDVAKLELGLL
ncbi:MAG: putative FeS assembly SUF system protein SufT [Moritella sp.]|jgi:probable FeS assembly SUF system protein SufT